MLLAVLDVATVAAALFGIALASGPTSTGERHRSSSAPDAPRRRPREPGRWLLAIVALIFLNEILMNVYVIRVHDGDPGFIARYLPTDYFHMATGNTVLRRLAGWFPDPGLLSVTVLRVQSFLELPFGLLAYLTVARWAGAELATPRLLAAASVAWSASFMVVEAHFRTPYTTDDLVIRGISGIVTPIALWWLFRGDAPADGRGAPAGGRVSLGLLAISTAALGVLVLVLYDTVLLYNLGRVGRDAPVGVLAGAVLAGARLAAARRTGRGGACTAALVAGLRTWLVVFFAAALPIRYAMLFGTWWLAVAATLATVVAAAARVLAGVPRPVLLRLGLVIGAAFVASLAAAALVTAVGSAVYPEVRTLAAMVVAVGVAALGASLADRRRPAAVAGAAIGDAGSMIEPTTRG